MIDMSRFTDRSRKVMQIADREARLMCHERIGTAHILWGLWKEGSGVAANVLKNLGMQHVRLARQIEATQERGPTDAVLPAELELTQNARQALDDAREEARKLNHNYVGTEHLLLGLLRVTECTAVNVLKGFGMHDQIVPEIMGLLGQPVPGAPEEDADIVVLDSTVRRTIDVPQPSEIPDGSTLAQELLKRIMAGMQDMNVTSVVMIGTEL